MATAEIKPFTISVPQSSLDTLQQRLALTRLPTAYDSETTWSHGVPLARIQSLLTHWKTNYSWRAAEAHLNATLPQFITPIEVDDFGSLDIHFVHKKAEGAGEKCIPLLFCHGWPGSFDEVGKILPLLTKGQGDVVFDVVAPSLVNFGFSQGVEKQGFGVGKMAETMHKLMLKLGYYDYVVQGGDLGSFIARAISFLYPSHCKACHTNFPRPLPPTSASGADLEPQTPFDKHGAPRTADFTANGRGYFEIHRTKPQTLGYLLEDSPVGLLAWIYEKLHDWSDSYPFTDDEILTWVSIYWFSNAGPAASVRVYRETLLEQEAGGVVVKVSGNIPDVPLGISRFHMEIVQPTRKEWCKEMGNLVFYNEHVKGGHFAAWEAPEELVADLRAMFGRGGGAAGIVKERDGLMS